jgi:hypothetical protein
VYTKFNIRVQNFLSPTFDGAFTAILMFFMLWARVCSYMYSKSVIPKLSLQNMCNGVCRLSWKIIFCHASFKLALVLLRSACTVIIRCLILVADTVIISYAWNSFRTSEWILM